MKAKNKLIPKRKSLFFKFILTYWLKFLRVMSNADKRTRLKKDINESEKTACNIFMYLLKDPSSKMYYDTATSECFLSDKDIYVFLESRNLKIINTVFGYDIPLQQNTEVYLGMKFSLELGKRRSEFKAEAMKKVEHSLHKTLDKLRESKENTNQ